MKDFGSRLANYLLFVVVALLLSAFQTSFWFQVFGWFPAPQLWIAILVFWILYRELWEGILMIYLLALINSGFTALPLSHFLAVALLTGFFLVFAKKRVYWAGSTFFMLATGACLLAHILFSFLISWRYDHNPNQEISIFGWITTWLVTMIASLPLHVIFSWFDHLTHKEHPAVAGTGIL